MNLKPVQSALSAGSRLRRRGKSGKSLRIAAAAALLALGVAAATPAYAESAYFPDSGTYVDVVAAANPFTIGGTTATVPTLNFNGETYIGIRALNEKLGIDTVWDAPNHLVTIKGRGRTITISTRDGGSHMNGQKIYSLSAIMKNSATYVPLRQLLEDMGYQISYEPASKAIRIDPIQENELTIGNATIATGSEGDDLTLLVNYPVISGYANADVQKKINDFLKSEAQKSADAGLSEIKEASSYNKQLEESDPTVQIPPVSYDGMYNVTYNEAGKLSLYVDYYEYTGGAHGMPARVPYTFDLATGELLTLKQAANNPNYVPIINKAIQEQIKTSDLSLLNPFTTIEPDRDFYLRHGAVVVYFSPYEYTAYAYGFPEFSVPFSAFR